MLMTSPWRRIQSWTFSPLTFVPLVLSRSVSTSLSLVFLDLDVKAADAIVVELDGVAFFAADGDRRGQVVVDLSPIGPIQCPQRHQCHRELLFLIKARDCPRRVTPRSAWPACPGSVRAAVRRVAAEPAARHRSTSTGVNRAEHKRPSPDVFSPIQCTAPTAALKGGRRPPRFRRFPPAATPWLITCRRNGSQAASGPGVGLSTTRSAEPRRDRPPPRGMVFLQGSSVTDTADVIAERKATIMDSPHPY